LARGAAGLTKFGHVFKRHAKGVPVGKGILALDSPHHRFFNRGNAPDILEGTNIPRFESRFLIEASMKSGSLIGPIEDPFEFFKLKVPDPLVRKRFEDRVPVFLLRNHDDPLSRKQADFITAKK
jgi:hypothetical protein